MAAPPPELMLGSASCRQGAGALRGSYVLGRGAPYEIVRVGLVKRVAQPEDSEDRRWSQNF